MVTLRGDGPRVRFTRALLRLRNPEIIRFLDETLQLLADPARYEAAGRDRLRDTLRLCARVPFYAQRFAGLQLFDAAGSVDPAAFALVPPLTKDDIRTHFAALQNPEPQPGRFDNTSGGSTGVPVRFVQDRLYHARTVADTLLFGLLNGKRPGDPEVKLWGSERDILEGSIGWQEKLVNLLFNRVLLNSFAMTEADMRRYIDRINDTRPVQIWAYVDSILELARFAARAGLPLHNPAAIVATAGTMYPEIRHELSSLFPRSRIVNQYGSREVGQIACDAIGVPGMLLFAHSNHVELVDATTGAVITEAGRPGRVLVTTFNNRSMPLVRFDIGDIAEYLPAQPGRHRAFAQLHGRENAHFITAAGTLVHGEYFTHLFYGQPWLDSFQVAQTAPDRVVVRYVPREREEAPSDAIAEITRRIRVVMGAATHVAFEPRTRIDRLDSGKYQFVRREFS